MSPTFFIQCSDTYSCRKEATMHIKQLNKKKARSTNQFPQGKPTQNAKSSHAQQHQSVLTHVLPFLALAVSRNDHFLWPLHNLVPSRCSGLDNCPMQCQGRTDVSEAVPHHLSQWQCDRIKSDRRETTGDPSELKQTMHSQLDTLSTFECFR